MCLKSTTKFRKEMGKGERGEGEREGGRERGREGGRGKEGGREGGREGERVRHTFM